MSSSVKVLLVPVPVALAHLRIVESLWDPPAALSLCSRTGKILRLQSVEGSRREPRRHLACVRQKGCFGADDKVVLASTGREAYAGGGFHRGAATLHATRHIQCAWTERAAQRHTASQPAPPPARKTREGKELALAMRTLNAAREGAPHLRMA